MGVSDSWKCLVRCYVRHQVYFPGNVVEGFVELVVTAPIQMVALRVKATGKEKVELSWSEKRENTTTFYERSETSCVYKELITLAGQMNCAEGPRTAAVVPPGRYTYPFVFQLPMNIPPTFSVKGFDRSSTIAYHVKAYVDLDFGRDAVDREWFTVLKPMPLDQWLNRGPLTVERDWQVKFCCCVDKGTIRGRLSVDRTIVAIDRDNLIVVADIDNTRAQEPVKSLEIDLIHTVTYRGGWKTLHTQYSAASTRITNAAIPPGTSGRITGTLPIPRDIEPSLVTWNTKSEYCVDLKLNIPWATDPEHSFPVMIAPSVDETGLSPPVTWNTNPFTLIQKGEHPEYYYSPPPDPCYPLNPIPLAPPPGAIVWSLQLAPQLPLPPVGSVAIIYETERPPGYDPSGVEWLAGIPQQHAIMAPTRNPGGDSDETEGGSVPPAQPQMTYTATDQPLLAQG